MKTVLLVVGMCLILCDGRIVKYRVPPRNQRVSVSYEDHFSDTSQDAVYDDENMHHEKMPPTIEYQPSYGYSRSPKRKYVSESDISPNRAKFLPGKNRGKHLQYAEIPQEHFLRESPPKTIHYNPEIGERKKEHRSIPRYEPAHRPMPSPPAPLYFKSVPPKASCPKNLLIGCTPTVTRVPCGGYPSGDTHNGGYHRTPMIGSPGPDFSRPSYQPQSPQYEEPHPPPAYQPHQPEAPSPFQGPPHPPQYTPSHQAKVTPKPPPASYPPMYRTEDSKFRVPSFSPPVRETPEEHSQPPFISAFPTTTTTTTTPAAASTTPATKAAAQVRTLEDNEDDDFPVAEVKKVTTTDVMKEGSGDEMDVTVADAQQTTTSANSTMSPPTPVQNSAR
ncbi:uncharacterized protein LOC129773406 [Toxorhynchites rutilus septentrionalis]|uniref:uncharacterized protein LOC129773406 n=1 Tax=Toxorhynchites rutilus septentrionalis TaxID=329112 RepID=UPI002479AF91|nr:uncharacterized protein LOC129773406 [Toxorhynchites rutilus septentrionalis]